MNTCYLNNKDSIGNYEKICFNRSKVCFLNEAKFKGLVCHERPRTIFKLIPAICAETAFRRFAFHVSSTWPVPYYSRYRY